MNIKELNAQLKREAVKHLPSAGFISTGIEGLHLNRTDKSACSQKCFYSPKIILMIQGRKRAITGKTTIEYRENQYLVSGVDVPGTSYIADASPRKPLITVSLDLDTDLISQMIAEMPLEKLGGHGLRYGLAVADADAGLMEAFLRLIKLLEQKELIAYLAPITKREIYSRILVGPLGRHLREFCTLGTQGNQIMRAVNWLKSNFKKPIRIDELAKFTHMAPTTFHRYFKKATSVSPIQYQKNLRLHEARRLMISESATVAEAAYAVGYESPTQFSREYKRHFGEAPKRDISA